MLGKFKRSLGKLRKALMPLLAIAIVSGIIFSSPIASTAVQTPLAGGETTVFNRTSKA